MKPFSINAECKTIARLPAEDIVILAPDTVWQVPWELMMLGPFANCGLIDGDQIRHVTVSLMMASAVRHGTTPDAVLVPSDYPQLPVLSSAMTVFEAAVAVVEDGWELAVVMDQDARVITARSVYCSLVSPKMRGTSAISPQACTRMSSIRNS